MRRDFSSCFRGTTFAVNFGRGSNVFIQSMTDAECREALDRATIGRLACAKDQQPYVIPIYFMIDGDHLYSFANLGQKIEWMRTNPLVCVECEESVSDRQWSTVIVRGRYEELPNTPEYAIARGVAERLFQKHPMWWEPATVPFGNSARRAPIAFRIHVDGLTGRRSVQEDSRHDRQDSARRDSQPVWLIRMWHRLRPTRTDA